MVDYMITMIRMSKFSLEVRYSFPCTLCYPNEGVTDWLRLMPIRQRIKGIGSSARSFRYLAAFHSIIHAYNYS